MIWRLRGRVDCSLFADASGSIAHRYDVSEEPESQVPTPGVMCTTVQLNRLGLCLMMLNRQVHWLAPNALNLEQSQKLADDQPTAAPGHRTASIKITNAVSTQLRRARSIGQNSPPAREFTDQKS